MNLETYSDALLESQIKLQMKEIAKDPEAQANKEFLDQLQAELFRRKNLPPKEKKK